MVVILSRFNEKKVPAKLQNLVILTTQIIFGDSSPSFSHKSQVCGYYKRSVIRGTYLQILDPANFGYTETWHLCREIVLTLTWIGCVFLPLEF